MPTADPTATQEPGLDAAGLKPKGQRIWFDTEFIEDGRTIDLISIGMVREDGATYYAECAEADLSRADTWVIENVIAHLTGRKKPRAQIAADIIEFAGKSPEFWAYYADYDWVALCQLFGRMIDLPKGWPMFCRDIKQWCVELGDPKLPEQSSTEHHALADAQWNREAFDFLAAYEAHRSGAGEPVAVKPLEWVEVTAARSDEDPSREPTGDYEAGTPFGPYYIEMYFGSDSYGWFVSFDGMKIADKDDPQDAKATAQADYTRRILSALASPAKAGELADSHASAARPAVTGEMVDQALDAADYIPNADNRKWMRRALEAAAVKPCSKPSETMVEAAWLAFDNACPSEHWKVRERIRAALEAALSHAPASMNGTQGEAEGLRAPDEYIAEFMAGVVGVVEANSFESLCLWQDYHERKSWVSGTSGYGFTISKVADMPVCISLNCSVVDGHKILFVDPTSQVVDHRIVREWLDKYVPKSAWDSVRDCLNITDAQNFCNVLFAAKRMKDATAPLPAQGESR